MCTILFKTLIRILGSPALEVRTKTLALAMDLVTTRTIEEMVQLLKKEVLRTAGGEQEDAGRYRQLLVRTLHACSIKFSDVAATVIPVLTDFLSENNEAAATDVLVFVREAIQRFETLRPLIVEKLLEVHIQNINKTELTVIFLSKQIFCILNFIYRYFHTLDQ